MSTPTDNLLDRALVARVLERLEVPMDSIPNMQTLRELYASWCQHIPFDNVRKIISLHTRAGDAFPGSSPLDYFTAWLQHGTGGTCWAGSGALHALLSTMGFDTERALGTMLVAPNLPPNHGSVLVHIDNGDFLLDTSILHGAPLLLPDAWETCIDHPSWGVRCFQRDGHLFVQWRPLHKQDGLECRIEGFGFSDGEFQERYAQTRRWSPFNYQVCARRNIGDDVIGLAFGNFINLRPDGRVITTPIDDAERRRVLIEEFGMSDEIIAHLPADKPTPPPPESRTATKNNT